MHHVFLTVKALFTPRWLWATLTVLAGMALLARLGLWQLDRLDQRRAYNAELAQALAAPPLELTGDFPTADPAALKDREIIVHGRFDYEQQMALKVQNWQGQAGVHLITPLLIDGSDSALLVDRGWIPIADAAPERWSQYDDPGPIIVAGFIALSQPPPRLAAASAQPAGPQREWFRVDIDAIQPQLPYDLLPFYVVQTTPPEGNVALPYRAGRVIDLSEGPHLGYAIQWFTFSLMLAVIYLIFIHKNLNEHEQPTANS